MKNKYLILDAMGVIFKKENDFENLYLPYLGEKYSFDLNKARELYYNKLTLGKITIKKFFKDLEIPFDLGFLKKLEIDTEFYDFAKKVKQKYNLIVLSNDCYELGKEIFKEFKFDGLIEYYITSGELGIRKPTKEIFTKLLKILKAKPNNCVFVDNRIENLESAKKVGIKIIYFERRKSKINNFSKLYEEIKKVK